MEEKLSEAQNKYIHKLYVDRNVSEIQKAELLKNFGVEHTTDLTKVQASKLIENLMLILNIPKVHEPKIMPAIIEKETAIQQEYLGDIVRPCVSPEQAVQAWKEYENLKQKVITKEDIQQIKGKEYIKKSGWRKLATFFNLSDNIIDEFKEQVDGGFLWRIKVMVTAKNGRTSTGVGVCASTERAFAHQEHDVYSTAHTRAKSRAISDLIGGGAVSAEEMGYDDEKE